MIDPTINCCSNCERWTAIKERASLIGLCSAWEIRTSCRELCAKHKRKPVEPETEQD